ncbi:DUF397 domain-containing protein [Thermopolyspora sp. NPDC052614]|uniref:DUF397 domain-containing protein n=1 Tax=Thermopolyspora sp. NPDC052614 TaxID=3155682 RepID=UPI0034446320
MSPMGISGAAWRKSVRSANGNCVEVALLADGRVGVRDSKDRHGRVLMLTPAQWRAFVSGVRKGEIGG